MSHPNVIRYYNSWLEFSSPEVSDAHHLDKTAAGSGTAHKLSSPATQKLAPVEVTSECSEKAARPSSSDRFFLSSGLRVESMEFIGDSSAASEIEFPLGESRALVRRGPSNAPLSTSSVFSSSDASCSSSGSEESCELSDHVSSQLVLMESSSGNFDITLYLQMESCRDFTLSNLIGLMREGREVPVVDRIQCMCEVAEALQHTHLNGIVHRDVKPDNIFFKFPCSVKLADFGLSKESANDPVMDEIVKFSGSGSDCGSSSVGSESPSLGALSEHQLTTSCGTVSCVVMHTHLSSFLTSSQLCST
jgi:serine/threonine protein kinase